MVGGRKYANKQIEWLLSKIAKGEPQDQIIAAFREKWDCPTFGKAQYKYLKGMYGADPEFGLPLVNRGVITSATLARTSKRRAKSKSTSASSPAQSAQDALAHADSGEGHLSPDHPLSQQVPFPALNGGSTFGDHLPDGQPESLYPSDYVTSAAPAAAVTQPPYNYNTVMINGLPYDATHGYDLSTFSRENDLDFGAVHHQSQGPAFNSQNPAGQLFGDVGSLEDTGSNFGFFDGTFTGDRDFGIRPGSGQVYEPVFDTRSNIAASTTAATGAAPTTSAASDTRWFPNITTDLISSLPAGVSPGPGPAPVPIVRPGRNAVPTPTPHTVLAPEMFPPSTHAYAFNQEGTLPPRPEGCMPEARTGWDMVGWYYAGQHDRCPIPIIHRHTQGGQVQFDSVYDVACMLTGRPLEAVSQPSTDCASIVASSPHVGDGASTDTEMKTDP
ncbi:hypothetical protein JX265_005940 [Neoarthrinium moseri]|uniref:Uncharacterized protein n=1 Tax=Neoarthrinium moseri TaxID=1658444 RepID=A0A9Q0AQN5_9PEZI|nr:hypothetical protein JX266_002956 [Neoarthrinium moseri]KAI1870900.1 hypothetical protein JX265_005940 [Neoarthrinium moseri]